MKFRINDLLNFKVLMVSLREILLLVYFKDLGCRLLVSLRYNLGPKPQEFGWVIFAKMAIPVDFSVIISRCFGDHHNLNFSRYLGGRRNFVGYHPNFSQFFL